MTKTILTYGTFDMFHIGHLRLLNRLKDQCERLVVGVSTDEFNHIKGKKTVIPFEQRAEIVRNIRCVDLVIPEKIWDQKINDIAEHKIDVFAMGDDWKGKFDDLSSHCEVMYLERTEGISTTGLKNSLKNFLSVPKEDIINALEILEMLRKDFE